MNDSSTSAFSIDKLMLWRAGAWKRYENIRNAKLRLIYDQLLISTDTKILETLNMNGKLKGIYKDDILILIINGPVSEVRKIKFQIKEGALACLQVLGRHFPIVSHTSGQSLISTRYRDFGDVLKTALEPSAEHPQQSMQIPPSYNNFVKLCLLDPMFPQLVQETQKILQNEI